MAREEYPRTPFVPPIPTGRDEPGGPFITLSSLTEAWLGRDPDGVPYIIPALAGDNAGVDSDGCPWIRG